MSYPMEDGWRGKLSHEIPPSLGGMTMWRGRSLSCVNLGRKERIAKAGRM